MPIIGTLPNNIQNGNTVDATPVMADFNFIVNQVNANANPTGTLTAPSGTRTVFHQAAAPVGWTLDATLTDHTIQVTNAGGGTVLGTVGYSAMFHAQWSTDGHALTTAELAAHNHSVTDPGHTHTYADPGHAHTISAVAPTVSLGSGDVALAGTTGGPVNRMQLASTGITINPVGTGITINNNGSGTAHSHTKTFDSLCVQMIMCQKA